MNPQDQGCMGAIFGIIFGCLITLLVVVKFFTLPAVNDLRTFKQQAIEHGAAEYDRTTGAWRWKNNLTGESDDE